MRYNFDVHHRRSIRLEDYDYSQSGMYFVTVCMQNRECFLGEIIDEQMVLKDAGRMVESVWGELQVRFNHIQLGQFVVMPNHIHGIFVLHGRGEPCVRPHASVEQTSVGNRSGEPCVRPHASVEQTSVGNRSGEHKVRPYGTLPDTVGRIVQAFKSMTTHEYTIGVKKHGWPPFPGKLWQRNYYEHIIRNENELNRIREYIANNPMKWEFDQENPDLSILETHAGQRKGQSG
ncbi:MAG TPA: hypothetical protein ENN79_12780 [Desulfobacteraceae bacterium]|nr:hypothetical protein [Desulfobacteraceae bacterium]